MAGIWYRKGTISVTNGSDIVTGVGSLWLDPKVGPQPGNIIYMPDGKPYEVGIVLSDVSLKLATLYGGASATGAAYAIVTPIVGSIPALAAKVASTLAFVEGQYDILDAWANGADTADVVITNPSTGASVTVPSLAKIVKMTGKAAVQALSALTPAADRIPYYTGPGAAALAPLTPFARTLLDDANAAEALATLGFIERGSNANGSYVKFADGTLICWHKMSAGSLDISVAFSGGFRTGGVSWTFPMAFLAAPAVSISPTDASAFGVSISTVSGTSALFFLTSVSAQAAASRAAYLIAVGRWA